MNKDQILEKVTAITKEASDMEEVMAGDSFMDDLEMASVEILPCWLIWRPPSRFGYRNAFWVRLRLYRRWRMRLRSCLHNGENRKSFQ